MQIVNDLGDFNEFIKENMPFVTKKVEAFVTKFPQYTYLQDDLLSEGFLALTKAAHELAKGKQGPNLNPSGLIYVCVRNALIDLVKRERHVPLTKDIEASLLVDPISEIELKVDLQALCKDEKDRRIIEMREQGHTDEEIGAELGISRSQAGRRRQSLHARYARYAQQ